MNKLAKNKLNNVQTFSAIVITVHSRSPESLNQNILEVWPKYPPTCPSQIRWN